MLRARELHRKGAWKTADAADRIVLTFDQRWRRRIKLITAGGVAFLLELPQALVLRDGDALALDDGRLVAVEAAGEDLLEIRGGEAVSLTRLAWHLGNRHTPAALEPHRILVRRDHVLAEMLTKLGASVAEIVAPFDPEGGAYATGHQHASHHGHDHGGPEHNHDHNHDH